VIARRSILRALPWLALGSDVHALPPANIEFPRDHASHLGQRTEWWYITGRVLSGAREFGFQVTFFRSRVDAAQSMQSRFAAKQLIFAHAAIADVDGKRLWHDQRIAREGFDVASAATDQMRLKLRDWSLVRDTSGAMTAHVVASDFAFDLRFSPTQSELLQGDHGLSRKGPLPGQSSYYYSEPQLDASGSISLQGKRIDVAGRAWLDHEWSDDYLAPQAVGWDWIGMNLDDGSALMAFRLRNADGSTLWDGGAFRARGHDAYIFSKGEAEFSAQRHWTSPVSGARYPVEWIVRTPADFYRVSAVVDNQELDSRMSTGAIYWEGLARLVDSNGRLVGHGYLEMTGYAHRLRI